MTHLDPTDRAAYLATLTPGSDVDHRSTTFDSFLLTALLDALRDPATTHPHLGNANFRGATFTAGAYFQDATFTADTEFRDATFTADAYFRGATFTADAYFQGATFTAGAYFRDATFTVGAYFHGAMFTAGAYFHGATFTADAYFNGVVVGGNASFTGVRFESLAVLGPLWCWEELDLSGAVFGAPVVIEAAAGELRCGRTRWEATATLRLWHADLDMSGAVLNFPLAVVSAAAGTDPVRVLSVDGVDAAHLVLTDTDLTVCRFLGAFHLDQLRLEGDTRFARTPPGTDLLRGIPLRWTDRLALAEEHHWRALPTHRPRLRAGWTPAPPSPSGSPSTVPGPAALAALYRQLRKAFEDGKDEPGAADFYMGETEMRRLDRRPGRNRAERGLLTAYWALSGYGLRASRAITWLLLAMTATVLAMMLWGLPTDDPKPQVVGKQVTPGQDVRLTVDTPDPELTGSPQERLTGKRAEKATRVVLNSVVFRSSGQNLTTTGTYVEMGSRLLEPVLLALAVLAIRGRVKR
ncbi:pentapeptide repeat-containing protein [Embleya sp. NPDC127516]|uniref:pentapeptide repeat-containing protein n=1 Tax=Embleya sp. NPDC127516 TaxID=3363990 RepID=UPI0037F6BF5E